MNPIIRFLLVAAGTGSAVVAGSLLWPRITNRPRPEVLQAVRDAAITTSTGKEAAKILGVENEEKVTPINPHQVAASVAGTIISSVQEKTKEIISQQVTTQIINQYQQLPTPQQQQLQEFICKPK